MFSILNFLQFPDLVGLGVRYTTSCDPSVRESRTLSTCLKSMFSLVKNRHGIVQGQHRV